MKHIDLFPALHKVRPIRGVLSTAPARGVGAQLIVLSSILGVQLLQVPVFLSVMTPDVYGSYLALIAVPSVVAMADFGFLSASSTRLIGLVARGQYDTANALFRLTFTFVSGISVFLVIAAGFITCLFDLAQPGIVSQAASEIVLFYVIYSALSLLSSAAEMAMRANSVYASAWLWLSAIRVGEFIACITSLVLTSQITVAVFALMVSRGIGLALFFIKVRSTVSWLSVRPLFSNARVLSGLLHPTLGSAALPIGNALLNQGLLLSVNAALGPGSVVIFSTARTLMNTGRQVTNAIANGVLPGLTQHAALGRMREASRLLRNSFWLAFCLTATIAILLTVLGPRIVSIWTLGRVEMPNQVLVLLALLSLIEACWLVLSLRLLAVNEHFRFSAVYVLSATGVVAFAFFLHPESIEPFISILIGQSVIMLTVIFFASRRIFAENSLV